MISPSNPPARYHPVLVTLHWLLAALVFFMLGFGFYLESLPNDSAKAAPLTLHMVLGHFVLFLMAIRLVVRLLTRKPAPVSSPNAILDRTARAVHWLFYAAIVPMVLLGRQLRAQAGLDSVLHGEAGASWPQDLLAFPAGWWHACLAVFLILLIAVHVGAAIYHQFVRKDHLMTRMWFG